MCTIWWILSYVCKHGTVTTNKLLNTSAIPKVFSRSFLHIPLTLSSSQRHPWACTGMLSIMIEYFVLSSISSERNHAICSDFCLAFSLCIIILGFMHAVVLLPFNVPSRIPLGDMLKFDYLRVLNIWAANSDINSVFSCKHTSGALVDPTIVYLAPEQILLRADLCAF